MKISVKILAILTALTLSNCTTHGNFVTEHQEAWFNDQDDGLFFCRANLKDNGLADPVCFEAGLHTYDDVIKDEKKSSVKK